MAAWQQPGFVVSIIGPNGQPIREHSEKGNRVSRIPFGSEYKIRIKNKTNYRALVNVEIDGMKVLTSGKFLLRANDTLDLERFVDSLSEGARFKFVEATNGAVQDPSSWENGRIRVTFDPEMAATLTTAWIPNNPHIYAQPPFNLQGQAFGTFMNTSVQPSAPTTSARSLDVSSCVNSVQSSTGCAINSAAMSDAGATVDGSKSQQAFGMTAEYFPTLAPVTIDLWIKGPKMEVKKPFVCFPALIPNTGSIFYEGKVMHGVKEFSLAGGDVILKIDASSVEFKT